MREAAKEFKWHLNYGSIALMWRGGCIIRRYLEMCVDVHMCMCVVSEGFRPDTSIV